MIYSEFNCNLFVFGFTIVNVLLDIRVIMNHPEPSSVISVSSLCHRCVISVLLRVIGCHLGVMARLSASVNC